MINPWWLCQRGLRGLPRKMCFGVMTTDFVQEDIIFNVHRIVTVYSCYFADPAETASCEYSPLGEMEVIYIEHTCNI